MADLSLLLDVILKTQSAAAKQAICKNGILHQLQVGILRQAAQTYMSAHQQHSWRTCKAPQF